MLEWRPDDGRNTADAPSERRPDRNLVLHRQRWPASADRFLDAVDQKCETLVRFPRMGQACDGIAPGLRFFTMDRYVIFYHPIDAGIEIVRVVSGARDAGSLF